MSAPKRIPASKKVKGKEEINKKAIYWTVGAAVAVIVVLSVLIVVFS